jgi:hypothetical protein
LVWFVVIVIQTLFLRLHFSAQYTIHYVDFILFVVMTHTSYYRLI